MGSVETSYCRGSQTFSFHTELSCGRRLAMRTSLIILGGLVLLALALPESDAILSVAKVRIPKPRFGQFKKVVNALWKECIKTKAKYEPLWTLCNDSLALSVSQLQKPPLEEGADCSSQPSKTKSAGTGAAGTKNPGKGNNNNNNGNGGNGNNSKNNNNKNNNNKNNNNSNNNKNNNNKNNNNNNKGNGGKGNNNSSINKGNGGKGNNNKGNSINKGNGGKGNNNKGNG